MGASFGKREEHLPPGRSRPVSNTVASYLDWRCWAQDKPAIPPPMMATVGFCFDVEDVDILRMDGLIFGGMVEDA